MPEISNSPVSELEEELEEELLDDEGEATSTVSNTERKKRLRLHEDNVYIFATLDEAKEGQKHLKYDDDSEVPVNAFRPFIFTRENETKGFVLARSSNGAAEHYLSSKGFSIKIAEPKARGGRRGRSKIESTTREYAIILACAVFGITPNIAQSKSLTDLTYKDGADRGFIEQWELYFAPEGTHIHYFDDNGVLKNVN